MMYKHKKVPVICALLIILAAREVLASPFMMIASGDPALDDLRLVALEAGLTILSLTPPLSRDEIENILNITDSGSLSEAAAEAYARLESRLNPQPRFSEEGFALMANLILQFEAGIRSNSGIPWQGNGAMRPAALGLPIGAYFFNAAEIFIAPEVRLDPGFNETDGHFLTNVPYEAGRVDMFFPFRAYIAFGGKNWNFQIGRDALNFGTARRGNLLISDSPDYYEFGRLSFFSRHFKYTALVTHIPLFIEDDLYDTSTLPDDALTESLERYLYIHRFDVNLFDKLSLAFSEGLTVGNSPLSLRYLNPLMIMHNWTSGDEYPNWAGGRELNSSIFFVEANWTPIRHLHFYGQIVIDELTT
ncbi:MAG: capsule assembly Wzi family protein, partial [Spirochaetaceae bacterium]|nr:capsule assembly Wzi family protein [Spirochaetaceae bacterium]